MAAHNLKKTGLLRAGFQYQDLVAITTLIRYYGQPNLYEWVQLDADHGEFRSIEDIVACRPDGLYELSQVKFTADPDKQANTLSWRWLTKRRGAGTSLLEKWSRTTLRHKASTSLARASLKTDRVPDAQFKACLDGARVNYSLLPKEIYTIVVEQLGSTTNAKVFFETFEFLHSKPRLKDLEDRLQLKTNSLAGPTTWHRFREQVRIWSMFKNRPEPDGRIRHNHLCQILSDDRPRPLPQGFRLSPNYEVPDPDFHKHFITETTGSDGLTVLWGPPGRGKSTYLSYCVTCIDSRDAVCIRHHYFLSLEDRSDGRFDYLAIARSLEHQLQSNIPSLESHNGFGQLLENAADLLRHEGRRLIIVIDGLDHVWREHRNRDDMEELFNVLLPLPRNVRLVVGTQKISGEHLPTRLRSTFPTQHWTELPPMSLTAVEHWLRVQNDARRLNLHVAENQSPDEALHAAATAFHKISCGSPLHLIYSFEMIARTGRPVTADNVAKLPVCQSGDIRNYYRSLWDRIGYRSKLIMHVLAGIKFGPPRFGILDWFGDNEETLIACNEIDHLLDHRGLEIYPFHSSLFSFVRDLQDHQTVFVTHLPRVIEWLEIRAPKWWKWAWLWMTKSQLHDTHDLIRGPDRSWAIGAIVNGYPVDQIINILNHAERAAFDAFDLPSLLRHRTLKVRVLNARDYQTDHWSIFPELAVSLSHDPEGIGNLVADLRHLPSFMLPVLVRNTDEPRLAQLVQQAHAELNQRVAMLNDGQALAADGYRDIAEAIATVAAHTGSTDTQHVEMFARSTPTPDSIIESYARESILIHQFENIFIVGERWTGKRLNRDVLAALCLEGLAPATKPKLKAHTDPAIRCFGMLRGEITTKSPITPNISSLFRQDNTIGSQLPENARDILYDSFFATLNGKLSADNVSTNSDIVPDPRTTWISGAVRALERLAEFVFVRWTRSRKWPSLRHVYGNFNAVPPSPRSYYEQRCFFTVRLALLDIAIDLCTIHRGIDPNASIDVIDIEAVSGSMFWSDELWLDAFSKRHLPLHSCKAAELLVERMGNWFDSNISQFDERVVSISRLAMFALDNNLTHQARKELRRAAGCLLGYGWRKDTFAFEVIESLDLLARSSDRDIRKAILDLAGAFEAITEYTDGSETSDAPRMYYRVIGEHFPDHVVACYAYLIRKQKWSYAESLIGAIVESGHFESRRGRAFLESYIGPSEVRVLERIDSQSLPYAKLALDMVHRKIGKSGETIRRNGEMDTQDSRKPRRKSVDSERKGSVVTEPAAFPPGSLDAYLTALSADSDYRVRQRRVVEWLAYWEDAGQVSEMLADLEAQFFESTYQFELGRSFDAAYKIALEKKGRSEAFRWIVRAHIACSGWDAFGSNTEDAHSRMREVARVFRRRWKEFIRSTSRSPIRSGPSGGVLSMGISRLVFFLDAVGEHDLAKAYGLEMVRAFKDDLAEQPIHMPEWLDD